jgi:geranylgeranyl transferase type-1 subunit beta
MQKKEKSKDFLLTRHINFFKMHINILPQAYEGSMNTSRMTALYFSVIGLDMLNALDNCNKQQIIDWVYAMQVLPEEGQTEETVCTGGFRGSTHAGGPFQCEGCRLFHSYDGGHLAMTYTALCVLLTLGDDLSRVNKHHIIQTIKNLQQPDGSFTPTKEGAETDSRFVYCASAICFMLKDFSGIDIPRSVSFLQGCFNYDGSMGLNPGRESHGGAMYTGVASLLLLGRGDVIADQRVTAALLKFCVNRLTEGFNGRPNKQDDTCYTFWVGATLTMLKHQHILNSTPIKSFLLETQTHIGGFGKHIDSTPDILHAFYGIAGWSLLIDRNNTEGTVDVANPICPLLGVTQRVFDAFVA